MRYKIGRKLGAGGAGEVRACRDPATKLEYAVKLVNVTRPDVRLGLLAEFDLISRLDHPNIIKVHDFGIEGGQCFLVMDLIKGYDARAAVVAGIYFYQLSVNGQRHTRHVVLIR